MVDSVVKTLHVDALPTGSFAPQSFYLHKGTGGKYNMYLSNETGNALSDFTEVFQLATGSVNGLMTKGDKAKLDGIAAGANNYTHPSGDGNLHMPPTGTTSNNKFLVAGATAGNTSWRAILSSDIPTLNQNTTGNAATATKLQTPRTIGGVTFDGTANINLPGVNTVGNQSTTGNAATATKLATARTIGGVSFDGTANISLPGVDTGGNQNTTGNAATSTLAASATKLATPRTINGTAFDGSANITTANWGTARTISYTGDVTGSASMNGGANVNFAMTLSNTGVVAGTYRAMVVDAKGRATRGVPMLDAGMVAAPTATGTANAVTTNATTYLNVVETVDGNKSATGGSVRITGSGTVTVSANANGVVNISGAQNITGNAATATRATSADKLTNARTIGGVAFDGTANINLPGVNTAGNQNTTGNAATATQANTAVKLTTARTINGTAFDGSANITTANWGTTRTFTIAGASKTVNGSANVSFTVQELGLVDLNNAQTLTNKILGAGTKEELATPPQTSAYVINVSSPPFTQMTLNQNASVTTTLATGVSRTVWINPSSYTVSWSGVTWTSGSAPSLTASKWNCIVFTGAPGGKVLASYLGSL